MDTAAVGKTPLQSTQGIYLAYELALTQPADRRVAGHLAYPFDV
jgi:hypothetical protein